MNGTLTQVYRANSGAMVYNYSQTPCAERENFVVALWQTYAKWYRRYKGTEAAPGQAGS